MSVVAELTVPPGHFALASTLEAVPSVEVEFERSVTHSQEWIMPFLWVRGEERSEFERAIDGDPTVAEARVIDRYDDTDLYMVRWADGVREMVNAIFDRSGILVEATGSDAEWRLVVQFVDYASLSDLESYFQRDDTPLQLERLFSPESPQREERELTSQQLETLVTAAERGYFDVPRRATLGDIARELGISTTAVSERLRRGLFTLVTDSLDVGEVAERDA